MTDTVERLYEVAGPHECLAREAADEIERLRGLLGDATEEIEHLRGLLADLMMVYCVLCIDDRDRREDRVHIFTSLDKAKAWASTDPRRHVIYDYLLDHPGRMERAVS